MTITINGENVEDLNNIEITQNAADEGSTLTCVPDCPQEEYEYDYEVNYQVIWLRELRKIEKEKKDHHFYSSNCTKLLEVNHGKALSCHL